jgi:hypothetical protein
MNLSRNLLFITVCLFSLGLFSCTKKCDIPAKDSNQGEIIENVVIYPTSGSMTGNMGDDLVIDANHKYANDFQISFNNSPRTNVNYGMYKILCCPTNVSCTASFERKVTIDHDLDKVVYSIVATYCEDCWTKVYVENYVLVPAFPDNYEVVYDVEYKKI